MSEDRTKDLPLCPFDFTVLLAVVGDSGHMKMHEFTPRLGRIPSVFRFCLGDAVVHISLPTFCFTTGNIQIFDTKVAGEHGEEPQESWWRLLRREQGTVKLTLFFMFFKRQ